MSVIDNNNEYVSWSVRMLNRFQDLQEKIDDEKRNLSPFRHAEAFALALTKEEQREYSELYRLTMDM